MHRPTHVINFNSFSNITEKPANSLWDKSSCLISDIFKIPQKELQRSWPVGRHPRGGKGQPHFGAESSSQWAFLCRLHQQHLWDFDCKSPQQRSCMFHRCVTEPRIFQSGSEIVQHFGHLFCTPLTRFDLWDSTAPFKILIIYNHEYEMRTMLYSIPHLWMQRGLEPFSWNPENVAYFFSDQLLCRCRIQRSSKRIQMSCRAE